MYENDSIVRNSRPPGANSIETRLLICVFTRDYQFEIKLKPETEFIPYILGRFNAMFKPQDPKMFQTLIELEIINSIKLSFVTPNGDLTARGIVFIELSLNGSYGYTLTKFDNVMAVYMTTLSMEGISHGEYGAVCEECQGPELEDAPPTLEAEEPEKEHPEFLNVNIPMKDFIHLVNKYKGNNFWNRLVHLFTG